uniref:DNA replication complex GINS protein PSF1 n=1 Tax=Henneguya salminicola TaxID=69463 RepID=A0A6G3MJD4_HENSL
MYGEKAVEIIKELLRENEGEISKYNEEGVNAITQEINTLFSNNMQEVSLSNGEDASYFPGIQLRHSCIEHNKRCILSYAHHRITKLRNIRWDIGAILEDNIQDRLSKNEKEFFYRYCQNLDKYIEKIGLDITKVYLIY